jgi:dephospho-CoA kinase
MIKVAITGNIASGKSQIEKIISGLGFKVIDTDKVNHEILEKDLSAISEIKKTFQKYDILDKKNNISRQKLGEIIFSDPIKKTQLEKILHERINKKIQEFFNKNKNEIMVFVSIPLLFETNQENNFDKIIFVSADENTRLQRLIKRNGYSLEYAKKRIISQEKEENKIAKSDFIIYNNSDLANLTNQVFNTIDKIASL